MPLSKPSPRRHAALSRFKRRTKRTLMLFAVILVATYVLNFFFSFSSYLPKFYEPKDFEREMLMKKLDGLGAGSGTTPGNGSGAGSGQRR